MQQRETKWKYAAQYRAYLYKCTITWETTISYKKFADRLRHKIKRDQKKMQTKMVDVIPTIEPTNEIDLMEEKKRFRIDRITSFLFMIMWFILGMMFLLLFVWPRYNSKIMTTLHSSVESKTTGTVEQEYLNTGSECEWKPSLSTNGSIVCRK